jgi:hypothetical protein
MAKSEWTSEDLIPWLENVEKLTNQYVKNSEDDDSKFAEIRRRLAPKTVTREWAIDVYGSIRKFGDIGWFIDKLAELGIEVENGNNKE